MDLNNISIKVNEWRDKARRGELTEDEAKEAIVYLRGARSAGVTAATTRKSSAASVNVDDMLKDLGI